MYMLVCSTLADLYTSPKHNTPGIVLTPRLAATADSYAGNDRSGQSSRSVSGPYSPLFIRLYVPAGRETMRGREPSAMAARRAKAVRTAVVCNGKIDGRLGLGDSCLTHLFCCQTNAGNTVITPDFVSAASGRVSTYTTAPPRRASRGAEPCRIGDTRRMDMSVPSCTAVPGHVAALLYADSRSCASCAP